MLVNPPKSRTHFTGCDNYFPLGLLSLATVLKVDNIDIKIIDMENTFYGKEINPEILNSYIENELHYFIRDYKPDIIGIGCLFSGAFDSLKKVVRSIKFKYPAVPIVIGGIHPTTLPREILHKYVDIDYIILGEGEQSFLNLIRCLNGNGALTGIDGIAFRINSADNICLQPKTSFIADLDALPQVDYSFLNLREYYNMDTSKWYSPNNIKIGQPFPIISSRSCPQRCSFCSMWLVHGPRFRARSSENVINEIGYLYDIYGANYFQFMDDNMTFDKKRTIEICNGILRKNLNIQFDTPNGLAISRLDKEVIDAMISAGWVWTAVAVESGSDYIRNKVMKKGLSAEKIYEVVSELAKYSNLFIKGFFIAGMPEDTLDTLEETYKMIKELPFDKISVNFPAPYPGTELFKYCMEHNLINYKLEDYIDIEVSQDGDTYPHFKPHNLNCCDLVDFRKKCFDFMREKRASCSFPSNYPLRFKRAI